MRKKDTPQKHSLRIGELFGGISNAASVLSFLGVTASTFCGIHFKSLLYAVPAVVILVLLVAFWLCKRNQRRIIGWIQGLFAPNFPYRLTSWEIEYEYKSMDEMCYRADYEVRAMQTGVDHIRVRYNWSGETADNPIAPVPVTENGYQTDRLCPDGKEYGYSYYKVLSRTKFNKKDGSFKLGVRIDPLRVGKRPVSHHLLASISMATDVLVMRVLLPQSILPTRVELFEYLHATDDYHWHIYEGEVRELEDGRHSIEWPIPHPIYGGKYVIRWNLQVLTDG